MTIAITRRNGREISPYLEDLARLRIEVFRSFPYLYDGDRDYERRYLETYARSRGSLFVLAKEDEAVVGAATAIPMADETDAFKRPFIEQGFDPVNIFYFGESVLLPDYRGQGIGVAFFDHREDFARQSGRFTHCCFCAVERPADHPLKPVAYTPLDNFWNNRGYRKVPALQTRYAWKDVGDATETAKTMTFWIKPL